MTPCEELDHTTLAEAILERDREEAIQPHLESCKECRSRWVDIKKIAGAIRQRYEETIIVDDGFVDTIGRPVEAVQVPSRTLDVVRHRPLQPAAGKAGGDLPPPSKISTSRQGRASSSRQRRLDRKSSPLPWIALAGLFGFFILVVLISLAIRNARDIERSGAELPEKEKDVGRKNGEDPEPPAPTPYVPWPPAEGQRVTIRLQPEAAVLSTGRPADTGPAEIHRVLYQPLRIRVSGEGTIDMERDSWFRLTRTPDHIHLDLVKGRVMIQVEPDELPVLVRTRHGMIGPARGRFAIRATEDGSGLAVFEAPGGKITFREVGGEVEVAPGEEAWVESGKVVGPVEEPIFAWHDWWSGLAVKRDLLLSIDDAIELAGGKFLESPDPGISVVPGCWHRLSIAASSVEGIPGLVLVFADPTGRERFELPIGPEPSERIIYRYIPLTVGPEALGRIRIGVEGEGRIRFGGVHLEALRMPQDSVLLGDDYGAGWTAQGGLWSKRAAVLIAQPAAGAEPSEYLYLPGRVNWRNITLRVAMEGVAGGVLVRHSERGAYRFSIEKGTFRLERLMGVTATALAEGDLPETTIPWREIELRLVGNRIRVQVDGQPLCSATDAILPQGTVGLFAAGTEVVRFFGLQVTSE